MDTVGHDARSLLTEACTFAFPLVLSDATMCATTENPRPDGLPMTNRLLHSRHLANANSKSVVTPNVDTLYTQVFFDLGSDAYVFHKPAADRFFSIEILDAWTNATVIMGTAGDTEEARSYLITGPLFAAEVPDDPQLVHCALPTNHAWMIARTVTFGPDDYQNVYRLQDAMKLVPYDTYVREGFEGPSTACDYPSSLAFVPIHHVVGMSARQFFSAANTLMETNPPAPDDAPALERFRSLGVGPGLAFETTCLGDDLDDAGLNVLWRDILTALTPTLLDQSKQFIEQRGIWQVYGAPIAQFGVEYAYRALIALGGLGANPVSVAIYPKAETDNEGNRLDGTYAYRVHFDPESLEPFLPHGFWSLTAYGEDKFLIDNEIDRYAITDRSGAKLGDDGSLDIFMQTEPPQDERYQANWLPVKAEPFHVHLRVYLPTEAVLNATWKPPSITRAG